MSLGRFGAMVLTAALACAGPVRADYAAGKAAWDAGRPAAALAEWRAAADGGDRRSMLALGRLYVQGLGAPQDFVLAHMWFNLAASRGEAAALEERDALAAKMTPAERAEARKRARDWRPGGAAAAPKPAPEAAPDAGPPPPRAIREAQSLLAGLGYDPGPADGKWGARTGKAYRAFLRDAGRPASDALTPGDLRALRAAAEGAGGAPPPEARIRTAAAALAASRGDIDGLKAALAAGADPDARDDRGWTALMHAANEGYSLVVPPLLAAKADPDLRAPDGATALFIAMVHGHTEIVAKLVEAGADASISGPKGKTVVDAAQARGDRAILSALGILLPGVVFRDCPECPEMVVVPAGSFMMGSPSSEEGRWGGEGPVHRVTIPAPFAVGKYEVTRGEFARFVSATDHDTGSSCRIREDGSWKSRSGRSWRSPGYSQTDRDPAVCMSWNDARAYVRWLSEKTARNIVCCRSRSGSTRRARGRRRAIGGGTPSAGTGRIATVAGAVGTVSRRRRQGASRRTVSDCTTCTGTCGSGWRIAGTAAMRARHRTGARGRAGIAAGAFCAAAPGAAFRGSSAPPSAAGSAPGAATSASGSVLPGRSPLESLPPYLGGPGGEAPWPLSGR